MLYEILLIFSCFHLIQKCDRRADRQKCDSMYALHIDYRIKN